MNSKFDRILIRLVSSRIVDLFPSPNKIRFSVYKKIFKLEWFVRIHHNVSIKAHHKVPENFKKINELGLKIGRNCLFEDNVSIDTTGNLLIGDNVDFVIDSIIYTHTHELEYENGKKKNISIPLTLKIDDDVFIGARAIVVGCKHIGRFANIGAGSVVRSNVPPYAIVIGNPAKIVGFKFTPEEMVMYEKGRYDEEDRTPIEKYTKYYNKYFIDRPANTRMDYLNL